MNKICLLLLILIQLFSFPALSAVNEASFSPDSVRVPIYRLSLRNSSTGVETYIYQCGAAADSGCVRDLVDATDLAAITSAAIAPAPGTYDQAAVQYCRAGSGYEAQVSGAANVGGTTHYTAGNTDVLSTDISARAYVNVWFSGCATRYELYRPVTITSASTVFVKLLSFNRMASWMRLAPKSLPSGCAENAAQTKSVCLAYPDLIPVVSAAAMPRPTIEGYGLRSASGVSMDEISGLVLLVTDQTSGELVTGMTRRLFSEDSVEFVLGFDTALKSIQMNSDGTFELENYGSTATGPGYLSFPRFDRGTDHAGTLRDSSGARVSYYAYYIGDGGPTPTCVTNTSPTFTHMMTDLASVQAIVPLGTPATGGATKARHQVQNRFSFDGTTYTGTIAPVISPTEVRVIGVRKQIVTVPYADTYYAVQLEVSCEVTIVFDHIRRPSPKLVTAVGTMPFLPGDPFRPPVVPTAFAAGERIGETDGNPPASSPRAFAWDFLVTNTSVENAFANQPRYRSQPLLFNFLRGDCAANYYTGSLQDDFLDQLGYGTVSARRDCRNPSRDVIGALAGMWYSTTIPFNDPGFRIALATEITGEVRIVKDPFYSFYAAPIDVMGANPDPALASGMMPYCYKRNTTSGSREIWFQLQSGGSRLASTLERYGNCSTPPSRTAFVEHWER